MRRLLAMFPLILLACLVFQPVWEATPTLINSPTASSPPPTASPSLSPSPSTTIILPTTSWLGFVVRFHPDGQLFVGDLVSIEVIAPHALKVEGRSLRVLVGEPPQELSRASFGDYGIAGRHQATLRWAWDTRGLRPGEQLLTFVIEPEGISWSESVTLADRSELPPPEPQAHWSQAESACCIVNYITGTAAARQINWLLAVADEQGKHTSQLLGMEFIDPIPITILPRVLGHGGFASNEVYISYLEQNYAGSEFAQVLHHEMVHLLDSRLGGELRPAILVEGLAVYLSGGHFKVEPLLSRTASLLRLGWYIPLERLADGFYAAQHEIGYLEGGALVQFIVRTWGWQAFQAFYRDIHHHPTGRESQAIDQALQLHFGVSLEQLEDSLLWELQRQWLNPDLIDDVRLTVAYFEAVRTYQQLLDPSAYFLTAWLPDGEQMRQRGIVADYLRHPQADENRLLESLFQTADAHLRAGNYLQVEQILGSINAYLSTFVSQEAVLPALVPLLPGKLTIFR